MLLFLFVLFLVVNVVFCRISILFYKRYWNPIFLSCIVFIVGCLLIAWDIEKKHFILIEEGLYWLFIGETCFIGSFFMFQYNTAKSIRRKSLLVKYNKNALKLMSNLCVLFSVLESLIAYHVVMKAAGGEFLRIFMDSTAVRHEYLSRESSSTLVVILQMLISFNFYCTFCLLPLALKEGCPNMKKKIGIVIFLRLFLSLITMSKESFILTMAIFISANATWTSGIKDEIRFLKKYSIYFVVLFIGLLLATAFQRNYTAERYENYTDAVVGTLGGYIADPIKGYFIKISHPSPMLMGEQCFRPIVSILSRFGLSSTDASDSKQSAISEIDNLNVFSMYGNMYNDFGYWGIVLVSLFWGAIFGLLYCNLKTNRLSLIVTNAIILSVFILSFYDFLLMQTVYVLTIVYAMIFEHIFKNYLYGNRNRHKFYSAKWKN